MQVSAALVSQAAQALPIAPQLLSVELWQTAPAQQPLAHEVASQTHWPATQRVPDPHAAPMPQEHAPCMQPSATVALHD